MEIVVFVAIILLAIGVAMATHKQATATSTNNAYNRLAAHHNGKVSHGGWFRSPAVTFDYHGANVLVDIAAARGATSSLYTQVSIHFPRSSFRMELHPVGLWSKVGRILGLQHMEVGNLEFDANYVVHTNSKIEARQFLSDGVQWNIQRLAQFLDNHDIYVLVDRGRLIIRKKSFIRTYADLEAYVQMCLDLYSQAMLSRSAGIKFVPTDGSELEGLPICKVCGDDCTSDVVYCRRCHTPHHRECWNYNGACSIYGCGENRYATARPAEEPAK